MRSDEQIRLVAPIAYGCEAGFGQYMDQGWRLVKPLPGQDRRAAENLAIRAIPTYMAMAEYSWRDTTRIRYRVRPLFPSYLFAVGHIDADLSRLGIASVEPIADQFQLCLDLHRLEAMRLAEKPVLCPRGFKEGQLVRVTEGIYEGFTGVVERVKGRRLLAVLIKFMSRVLLIDLDSYAVEPIARASA